MKQKARASADFLGVLTNSQKVVGRCGFPITLFIFQSAQEPRVSPGVFGWVTPKPRIGQVGQTAEPESACDDAKRPQRPAPRPSCDCRSLQEATSGRAYPWPSAGAGSAEDEGIAQLVSEAGSGAGASTGAEGFGAGAAFAFFGAAFFAAFLGAAFLADFAAAFLAAFFGAAFLADFFAAFFAVFLADFFADFLADFLAVFLAATAFFAFLAFLLFFFFAFAIVVLLLPPNNGRSGVVLPSPPDESPSL
ncbi:hypothetical protein ABIA43_001578 [Bradyrhizobium sp. USDA 328]